MGKGTGVTGGGGGGGASGGISGTLSFTHPTTSKASRQRHLIRWQDISGRTPQPLLWTTPLQPKPTRRRAHPRERAPGTGMLLPEDRVDVGLLGARGGAAG